MVMGTLFLQHGIETLLALAAFFVWHRFRESGSRGDLSCGAALSRSGKSGSRITRRFTASARWVSADAAKWRRVYSPLAQSASWSA
jgi:hypothetical protein